MGKVIRLHSGLNQCESVQPLAVLRPERADRSMERSLVKVCSSLSSAGIPEMALDALVRWGDGRGRPGELLENVQSLAAVSGVRLPWIGDEVGPADWYPS